MRKEVLLKITILLAQEFLNKSSNETIIFDPIVYWNTEDVISKNGGNSVMSKTGHAFIKKRTRKEDTIYGGEMSAHHYFRDFNYCNSRMNPWLLVVELLSNKKHTISEVVDKKSKSYFSSCEINSVLKEP